MNQSIKVFLTALFIVLGVAGLALGDCDPTVDCDSCVTKGERMKCKFDALSNEGSVLLDQLNEPPFDNIQTQASLDGVQRSKDRLEKEKGRLQADDFRLLTKKKETSCQIMEAVYEDGICGPGEDCAEVIGDGIGNDDGICHPKNGKKREVCAQICDDEASLQDEENIDKDLSTELEGVFEEILLEYAVSYESWKKGLKTRMLIEKLIENELSDKIVITADDISRYYEKNYKESNLKPDLKNRSKDLNEKIVKHLRRKKIEEIYESWIEKIHKRFHIEINEKQWEKILSS